MRTVRAYSTETEAQMQRCYSSLREQDRRCYAAIEAVKIGHGGLPMDEPSQWTHLTRQQNADRLAAEEGRAINGTVVAPLLDKPQFRRRQVLNRQSTGRNPNRNQQFEQIPVKSKSWRAS